eukprot:jgi/Tetstr1/462462/TSEL_007458.t1
MRPAPALGQRYISARLLRAPPGSNLVPARPIMAEVPKRTIASFFAPLVKKAKVGDEPDGKTAAEGERQPESALTAAQQMRSAANKHMTLVRRAVKQAATQNEPLQLSSLLVEPGWREAMGPDFAKPYMAQLQKFLQQEWAGREAIFPPQALIFRAYNAVPLDKIKVVILGQDPYHGPGQAVGLCFSVPPDAKRPSSLLNIYKELASDCGCRIVPHGNLEEWAAQGIFMLNTVLTVRAHQANSHARKGWEAFTDETIRAISRSRRGVVFLLWGKQAQDKERLIDASRHHVLKCAHPSGLSASRGFFGCKHFSQTNALLEKQGLPPINWQV